MDFTYIINPLTNKKVKSCGKLGKNIIGNYDYDRITNPKTMKSVQTKGKIGKEILKKYHNFIQIQRGGSTIENNTTNLCDFEISNNEFSIVGSGGMGVVYKYNKGPDIYGFSIIKKPINENKIDILRGEVLYLNSTEGNYKKERFKHVVKMDKCIVSSQTPEVVNKIKMEELSPINTRDHFNNLCMIYDNCKKLMTGLEHLHTNIKISHFDIKKDNLMMRRDDDIINPVFIDMGLCQNFSESIGQYERHPSCTLAYTCPVTLNGTRYDKGRDYWALGCTLYELITGKPFIDAHNGVIYKFLLVVFNEEMLKYLLCITEKKPSQWDDLRKNSSDFYDKLNCNRCIFKRKLGIKENENEDIITKGEISLDNRKYVITYILKNGKTISNIDENSCKFKRVTVKNTIYQLFLLSTTYYTNNSNSGNGGSMNKKLKKKGGHLSTSLQSLPMKLQDTKLQKMINTLNSEIEAQNDDIKKFNELNSTNTFTLPQKLIAKLPKIPDEDLFDINNKNDLFDEKSKQTQNHIPVLTIKSNTQPCCDDSDSKKEHTVKKVKFTELFGSYLSSSSSSQS